MWRIIRQIVWWFDDTVGLPRLIILTAAITCGILGVIFSDSETNQILIVNAVGNFSAVVVALFPNRPKDRIVGKYTITRHARNAYNIRCVIQNMGKTIVTMGNYDSAITDSGAIIIANIFDTHGEFIHAAKIVMNKSRNRDFSSLRVSPGMAQEYVWDNVKIPAGTNPDKLKIIAFTSNGRKCRLRPRTPTQYRDEVELN